MNIRIRAPYQTPKLEVQRLRDLPSALAQSGCRMTPSTKMLTCSPGIDHGASPPPAPAVQPQHVITVP